MTKHILSLGLLLAGSALAFRGTAYLVRHHPVVSPHSQTESTVTFIFWLAVVVTFIIFPVFLGFRCSQIPIPSALRGIAWVAFLAAGIYLWRDTGLALTLLYLTA